MSRANPFLSLLFGLAITLKSGVSGARTCQELFTTIFTEVSEQAQSTPQIESNLFNSLKNSIREKIDRGDSLKEDGPPVDGSSLALFEVIAEKSGWDLLGLSVHYSRASDREQKKVLKVLDQFSFADGISAQKLELLLTKLYIMANSEPSRIDISVSRARERLIAKRIELAFLKQSFLSALQDLGLVKGPTGLERIRSLRQQYSNYENLLISSALNAFSITYIGVPIHVPKLAAGASQPIPQALIEKIKSQGIDSARVDLRKIYSRHSNFQLAWNTVRKLYTGAMVGLSIFMSVQMFPMIEFSIASHFTTEQRLAEIQEATFSPEKVRQEQLNSWKQAFFEIEGRYPDPSRYPQDATEYNRVWGSLAKIPDDKLKVQFNIK